MNKAGRAKDRGVRDGNGPGETPGKSLLEVDTRGSSGTRQGVVSPAVRGKKMAGVNPSVLTPTRAANSLMYRKLFCSSLGKRVDIVEVGVEAEAVRTLAVDLQYEQGVLIDCLGFSRATISRKIKAGKRLDISASERVVGAMRLVGQVQHMVEESGDASGFDASAWVGRWLEQPLPALGGKAPAEFMNSATGQELVAQLLAQAQSGAYA